MEKKAREAAMIRQVRDLLEGRRFREAIYLIATGSGDDASGELLALQGLSHFLMEKYEAAVPYYQAALQLEPQNAEWPEMLMAPDPRELSRLFLTRHDEMKEVPCLNMLAVAWIQFQNHDWISHGEPLTNEVHEIPLAENDPARKRYWQTKILVGKTQPDPYGHRPEDVEKLDLMIGNLAEAHRFVLLTRN